ncbi:MAG: hypothetical protein ABII23_06955, partial [bacterium]
MMKIVLLDLIEEFIIFKEYLKTNNKQLDEFAIVALKPRLQSYLARHNVDFVNTLNYFNNDSHAKIIYETEKMMNVIREKFIFTDQLGLSTTYRESLCYYVRSHLSHIIKLLEILNNIYQTNKGCEFYAYVKRNLTSEWKNDESILFTQLTRYAGLVTELFAQGHGLQFTDINVVSHSDKMVPNGSISCKYSSMKIFIMKIVLIFLRNKKLIFGPFPGNFFKRFVAEVNKSGKNMVYVALNTRINFIKIMGANIISLCKWLIMPKSFYYFILDTRYVDVQVAPS